MEWSKIKSLAILILLTVNIVLLAMVGTQLSASARYEENTRRQALSVLEQSGIQVTSGQLPDALVLPPLTVTRDRHAELAMARALLGENVRTIEQSGGIRVTYANPNGSADFYSSGRFNFSFSGSTPTDAAGDPAAHATQCMELLGLEGALLSSSNEGKRASVTFRQQWDGVPVFDCTIHFVYEDGVLRSVGGQYLSGTLTATGDTITMSTATALLRFLAGRNENGFICSQITGIWAGYRMDAARPVNLSPVWYLTTDTQSDYILDAATGSLSRAE